MITNPRVLHPEFIPSEVKHRDAEVSHLSDTLRPLTTDNGTPAHSFLYGPSGAGKTCISQYTVTQLQEEIDVDYQYVNCWEDYTRFKTLYRVLEGINQAVDIHRQSTPKDELLDRLRSAYDGQHYVVILDEVDQLRDKDVLYDLYRTQNLTMVLIANREEDVFSFLDERLNSRLQSCARIRFSQYSLTELVSILTDRAQSGLEAGAIGDAELEMIANYAAGDARIAIGTLRNAARMASQDGRAEITGDVIRKAVSEAKNEIKDQTTEKLTTHQKIIYEIISEHGEIGGGELYDEYCSRVADPKTRRTMRNYITKLEQYNLITMDGNTKARIYRPTP